MAADQGCSARHRRARRTLVGVQAQMLAMGLGGWSCGERAHPNKTVPGPGSHDPEREGPVAAMDAAARPGAQPIVMPQVACWDGAAGPPQGEPSSAAWLAADKSAEIGAAAASLQVMACNVPDATKAITRTSMNHPRKPEIRQTDCRWHRLVPAWRNALPLCFGWDALAIRRPGHVIGAVVRSLPRPRREQTLPHRGTSQGPFRRRRSRF